MNRSAEETRADGRRGWPAPSLWAAVALDVGGFAALFGSFLFANKRPLQALWIGRLGGDRIAPSAPAGAFLFVFGLLLLTLGYLGFLKAARPRPGPRPARASRRLTAVAVCLAALFILLPPWLSTDIFSYFQVGWIWGARSANPYLTPPAAFPDYPAAAESKGANNTARTPYGPLWTHTEAIVWHLSGGHLVGGILLFKVLATLGCLGSAWLLRGLVRAREPGREDEAWLTFLAHPLVLIEGPGMGHYDPVPLLVLLLGLWLQERIPGRRWIGALFAWVAMLFKAAALPALGLIFYGLARTGKKRIAMLLDFGKALLACLAMLLAAGAWVFVPRLGQLDLLLGASITSMPYEIRFIPFNLLKHALAAAGGRMGVTLSQGTAQGIAIAVTAALLGLFALLRLRGKRSFSDLVAELAPLYAVITLALGYWRPWFLFWPLALAPLAAERWRKLILIYALLAMATYVVTASSGIGLFGRTW